MTYAGHVNVQPQQDPAGGYIGPRCQASSEELNEKGNNIQQDKYSAHSPGFDLEYLLVWHEIPDHASHDHVRESVGEERSDEDEDEPYRVEGGRRWIMHGDNSECKRRSLCQAADDDHGAVFLLRQDGLNKMGECCACEEDAEEQSCCFTGAECPYNIGSMKIDCTVVNLVATTLRG